MQTPAPRHPTIRAAVRAIGILVMALLCVAFASPARAAAKSIAIVVEGADSGPIRKQIVDLAPKSLNVVTPATFSDALAKVGQRGAFGAALWAKTGRQNTFSRIARAIDGANVDAAIVARVRIGKAGKELYVVWIDRGTDEPSIDEAIPLRGRDPKPALKKTLGPPLDALGGDTGTSGPAQRPEQAAKPAAKTEPAKAQPENASSSGAASSGEEQGAKPTTAAEPSAPSSSGRKKNDFGSALFVLGLDAGIGARFFDYSDPIENDPLSANLRPYDVFGAPTASVYGELYPLAGTDLPVLRGLGVTLGYARAFGLTSSIEGGEPISTTWDRFGVGARLRWRTGDAPSPVLGLNLGYGFEHFTFQDAGALEGQVPDVAYSYLRGGLDARFPIGIFAVLVSADYLAPLSAGQVYDRFTGSHVGGIDLRGGFGVTVATGLELRAQAEYTRYFYSFSPNVGDQYIAGGALDQFLFLSLGVAYAY